MTRGALDRLAKIPTRPPESRGECRVRSKRMVASGALSRQSRNTGEGVVGDHPAQCLQWVEGGHPQTTLQTLHAGSMPIAKAADTPLGGPSTQTSGYSGEETEATDYGDPLSL